jgi:chemotaxis regulatin CheY-phosphate phosphatase CheZ
VQDVSVLALKRLADAVYRIEDELVRLLVETVPPERLPSDALDTMNGARLRAGGRLNDEQMEGVLKALGF